MDKTLLTSVLVSGTDTRNNLVLSNSSLFVVNVVNNSKRKKRKQQPSFQLLAGHFIYTLVAIISVLLFALTGFVCTYKIQAEEECLSSNILCYECDSRYDPNCADPFELSSLSLADQQTLAAQASINANSSTNDQNVRQQQQQQQVGGVQLAAAAPSSGNGTQVMRTYKKMPHVAVCHGCCVKITSKTPEGAVYVKRTCTTNLQINYFMVGLVCMKESGDRGKMCFCETDYCNGQPASHRPTFSLIACLWVIALLVTSTRLGLRPQDSSIS